MREFLGDLGHTILGVTFIGEGAKAMIQAQEPSDIAWTAICLVITGLIVAHFID